MTRSTLSAFSPVALESRRGGLVESIDVNRDAEFLDSELLGLVICRVFVTVRHRQAWHDTTSSQYQGQTSLSIDLDGAKVVAERWRKQGSHFLIREVPAIALLSADGAAFSVDFHHDNSFGTWDVREGGAVLRVGTPLSETLRALGSAGNWTIAPNPNSIVQARDAYAAVVPVGERARFHNFSSRSSGPRYDLAWSTATAPEVSARGAHRTRRAFVKMNGPGSVRRGVDAYESAKRARAIAVATRLRAATLALRVAIDSQRGSPAD